MNDTSNDWQSQKAGSCWQLTFAPMTEYPEPLASFLEEYFGVVSCNYNDDGTEQYVAYQNNRFDEQDFVNAARSRGISLPAYDKEFLESQNWLKDYVIEFPPVEVEDFFIYGVHEKETPQTDKLALRIYAATAFGSSHPTTQSCLRAISWLNKKMSRTEKSLTSAPVPEFCPWLRPNCGTTAKSPPSTLMKKPSGSPDKTLWTTGFRIISQLKSATDTILKSYALMRLTTLSLPTFWPDL